MRYFQFAFILFFIAVGANSAQARGFDIERVQYFYPMTQYGQLTLPDEQLVYLSVMSEGEYAVPLGMNVANKGYVLQYVDQDLYHPFTDQMKRYLIDTEQLPADLPAPTLPIKAWLHGYSLWGFVGLIGILLWLRARRGK